MADLTLEVTLNLVGALLNIGQPPRIAASDCLRDGSPARTAWKRA